MYGALKYLNCLKEKQEFMKEKYDSIKEGKRSNAILTRGERQIKQPSGHGIFLKRQL